MRNAATIAAPEQTPAIHYIAQHELPRIRPNRTEAARQIFEQALQLHAAGSSGRAIALYQRVLQLKPNYAEAHNNLAVALAALGRVGEAILHYEQAVICRTHYMEAYSNLGGALVAQGRIEEAVAAYRRALRINPRHAAIHYNLAVALAAQGRNDAAAAEYREAILLDPNCAEAHNNLANLLAAENRPDDAIRHYTRAMEIDPDHAEAHNNLGNVLRDLGRFEEALAHYDRAIAIRPDFPEAHYHRAAVKRFHPRDVELAVLEALASRAGMPAVKVPFIHFALAKAYEDCGDYARAFDHLRAGNSLKRAQIHFDEPAVGNLFQRVPAVFDQPIFDRFRDEGDSSELPVFLIGMPRSGSTLVEQILAGHPQIHSVGESMELERSLAAATGGRAFPDCVRLLGVADLRRIGGDYLSRLPAAANGESRVVNKLPGNFLFVGLIRLILPNARIIHAVRDPLDTCVSCYSHLFTAGHHFSYDLGELGRYYGRYRALMNYWRAVLPAGAILDVAYEDVVSDLEREARRLIAFCGLDWNQRCLDFNAGGRFVRTASAVQVRQPLFRSSVGRWRRYEFGIVPLIEALESAPEAMAAHNSM